VIYGLLGAFRSTSCMTPCTEDDCLSWPKTKPNKQTLIFPFPVQKPLYGTVFGLIFELENQLALRNALVFYPCAACRCKTEDNRAQNALGNDHCASSK
jgi:hypothetical protein